MHAAAHSQLTNAAQEESNKASAHLHAQVRTSVSSLANSAGLHMQGCAAGYQSRSEPSLGDAAS